VAFSNSPLSFLLNFMTVSDSYHSPDGWSSEDWGEPRQRQSPDKKFSVTVLSVSNALGHKDYL